jgi:photosystem II stability/assembly factor-like uncharacterized protein
MRALNLLPILFLVPAVAAGNPKPDARINRARREFYFEENRGQWQPEIRFMARTSVGPAGLGTSFIKFPGGIQIMFEGAGRPRIAGAGRKAGTTSYFSRRSTTSGVPHFTSITYGNLYRGIDAEFHENQGALEWDFHIAPGADTSRLALSFSGPDRPSLDDQGNLRVGPGLTLHLPAGYQEIGGSRRAVAARYVVQRSKVRIELAAYDRSQPLVIDPVVSWSIAGGSDVDLVTAAATDAQGNIYLAGRTSSADLFGSRRTAGGPASFVTKLDPTGSEVLYTAFMATSGPGTALQDLWGVMGLAVDQDGAACIAGRADASGFPLRNPLPGSITAGVGAFAAKLNPAGNDLVFATFLESTAGGASANGIAVDDQRNIYLVGATRSGHLLELPTQASFGGGNVDAFLTKLAGDGARILFSTYLGGSSDDTGTSVALDSAGNIVIAGNTVSADFPLRNDLHAVRKPGHNPVRGFVARWTPEFQLSFSTLLGGSEYTLPHGVGCDAAGNIYVAGDSAAPDLAGATPPDALDQILLKSEDGGVTWVPRQVGLASHSVNDVQIVSSQTIYVATQDAGIFRSQDGGLTWAASNQGLTELAVSSLRFDTRNPQTIVAVTAAGLFQSHDGGKQWAPLSSAEGVINDAAIDPFTPGTLYSAHNHPLGVRKSADGGRTWRELIPAAWRTRTANWVLPDPANPGVIYTGGAFVQVGSSRDDIVLRSEDGGETWNPASSGLPPFPNRPAIAGGAIYVGFHNRSVYRSRDGGKSWEALSNGLSPTAIGGSETGYDIQAIAASEGQPAVLYVGTFLSSYFPSSGVFRSDNDGASWSPTNLPLGFVHAVAIDPTDPNIVYAGRETGMMVFVTKIDAAATKVVYTFLTGPPMTCCYYSLGGFSANLGYTGALTVSADGTAWVAGGTGSPVFPQINPLQDSYGGSGDVYLLQLSPEGEPLMSTFIGSSGMEYARAIAQAPDGSLIIGGITDSTDAPAARLGSLTPGRGEALLIRIQP